jgi:hypothetical protein
MAYVIGVMAGDDLGAYCSLEHSVHSAIMKLAKERSFSQVLRFDDFYEEVTVNARDLAELAVEVELLAAHSGGPVAVGLRDLLGVVMVACREGKDITSLPD